ncbi:8122_t:CDS:1, partial [Ambispora gerdemannii]
TSESSDSGSESSSSSSDSNNKLDLALKAVIDSWKESKSLKGCLLKQFKINVLSIQHDSSEQ